MTFLAGMVALMRRIERDRGWIWLAVLLGAVGIVAAAAAQAILGVGLTGGEGAGFDEDAYFAFALGGIWWLLMSIVLIFRPVGKAAMSVSK